MARLSCCSLKSIVSSKSKAKNHDPEYQNDRTVSDDDDDEIIAVSMSPARSPNRARKTSTTPLTPSKKRKSPIKKKATKTKKSRPNIPSKTGYFEFYKYHCQEFRLKGIRKRATELSK